MHEEAPLRRPILIGWAFAAAILLLISLRAIVAFQFPDPDDAMRLLEARDLLAGQSWWDVGQHRLASGLMHWSRLVDLPIVAVTVLVRPFIGAGHAERAAMVIVPLLTLGVVMALAAHLTRRLLDDDRARLSLLIVPLSVPILNQVRPMRIDHHGWQVALALAALLALLRPGRGWRAGALGGGALALLLTISLEGLPVAAALIGLTGVRWLLDPREGTRFLATIWAAAIGTAALHLAMRGPFFLAAACDAVSPVWLAILATGAAGATIAVRIAPSIPVRAAMSAGTVAACVAILPLVDPRCTAGPFAGLDPVVRSMWYERINEGMPIWHQSAIWAAMCVGLPIVGLVGSVLALRAAPPERRGGWWTMLGALGATFALAVVVNRAAATANAFAVPGAAYVLATLLARTRAIENIALRTVATAGALLTAAPGSAAIAVFGMPADAEGAASAAVASGAARPACTRIDEVDGLDLLPAGARVFAPLDMTPAIIARTALLGVTSGHHRNAAAMSDVSRAFTAAPPLARATIARYGARYLIGCAGLAETQLYAQIAPDGLWARLERGERVDWLTPIPIAGSPVLAWRVAPPTAGTVTR